MYRLCCVMGVCFLKAPTNCTCWIYFPCVCWGGEGRSLHCYLPVRDLSNSVSVTQAVPQSLHTLPVHSLVWGDSYLHENGLLTLAPGCGDERLWHEGLSLHVTACLTQQPWLLLPSKHPSASGCSFGQESRWISVLTSTEDVWEWQRG